MEGIAYKLGEISGEILPAAIGLFTGYYILKKFRERKKKKEGKSE